MANHIAFPDYPTEDLSVVLLRFRSGVIGKVVTAFAAGRPQDHSLRVYGRDRCVENNLLFTKDGRFELLAKPFFRHRRGEYSTMSRKLIELYRDLKFNSKAMALAGVLSPLLRAYGKSASYGIAAYPLRLHEHFYGVRQCLNDFVDCVRAGDIPRSTAVDSARTVATCLAGVEAYESGQRISVSEHWIPELGDPSECVSAPI